VTGLDQHDIAGLPERRLRKLARFHVSVAGSDDGREWWPLAIRYLSVGERLLMAEDREYFEHWAERERRRVADDPIYFTETYGHVRPERQGAAPIPFLLWPAVEQAAERCLGAHSQREVLETFVRERLVIVLKARQLGLTWLALHFGFWLMGFSPELVSAKVLALSKVEADAQKLLGRLRKINALLPPYLRHAEDGDTRGSLSRFKLRGRGEALSLVSSPHAARSEQGDLFLWDEAAFTRNGGFELTWTAAEPTIGDHGRAILISTGNGPAEAPGDGQGFATLFGRAASGEADLSAIFLPDDVHPDRSPEWRARAVTRFTDPILFGQEHASTIEEALAGQQGEKVYPLVGIAAAERLGAEYDELLAKGEMPAPTGLLDDGLATGIDWASYSHLLTIWETEAGGLYVPPGAVHDFNAEPSELCVRYHEELDQWVQGRRTTKGTPPFWPMLSEGRYDAAGLQQMSTFVSYVETHPELSQQWKTQRGRVPTMKVKFGDEISGKGVRGTFKAMTVGYLQWLFARSARGEGWAAIAISPQNRELLRQLRGLEFKDDGSGRIEKRDDHGPDALIAGAAPLAFAYRSRVGPAPVDEEEPEDSKGVGGVIGRIL
jgi:hypothetical protein